MDAYIIIGKPSVGKSSLVRGLTGIRKPDIRLMAHHVNGNFQLFARHSSLQEANILPRQFISHVQGLGVDAVLLTLWPNGKNGRETRFPSANAYLQEFQNVGWNIQPIIFLERVSILPVPVQPGVFYNTPWLPFNVLMAHARFHWSWA